MDMLVLLKWAVIISLVLALAVAVGFLAALIALKTEDKKPPTIRRGLDVAEGDRQARRADQQRAWRRERKRRQQMLPAPVYDEDGSAAHVSWCP